MRFALAIGLLCLAAPASATAGVPCFYLNSWTEGDTPVAVISPAGTAPGLAGQGVIIHVEILDCTMAPVANFPFQDIWVASSEDFDACVGGAMADANTDGNGRTTISGSIFGGGHTQAGLLVFINGMPTDTGPLDLDFASPDINGDLHVTLNDFALFGQDYNTSSRRSDLVYDGIVDLADFARFGQHYNESCP